MTRESISIIIPAYNEAENILAAVHTASRLVRSVCRLYEILIIDDGSTDQTGAIADQLTKKYAYLRVHHHSKNEGIGVAIRDGIALAQCTYITSYPADMDWSLDTFRHLLTARSKHSIVSYYLTNMTDREPLRQFFSLAFTAIMNTLFGLHLRYYNGHFICPSNLIKPLRLLSKGFTVMAEIKIRLIRKNVKYMELTSETKPRRFGFSKAFTIKTIIRTLLFLPLLVLNLYFNE